MARMYVVLEIIEYKKEFLSGKIYFNNFFTSNERLYILKTEGIKSIASAQDFGLRKWSTRNVKN